FTFSEATTDFVAADIITTGGSLGTLSTTDNIVYTATLTPTSDYDGNITISVADATYTDSDGNNGKGDSLTLTSTTVSPTLAITSDKTGLKAGETATISFTFSEATTDFVAADITTTGGSLGTLSTTDNITYTATLTPTSDYDGNITISVADATYTDSDGNNGKGDSLTLTSTTVSPTLAITSDKSDLKAEETATISFTFSEATTDFVAADITTTGGSLGTLSTTDNIVYTATLTPTSDYDGNITISVADATYTDSDGNNGKGDSLTLTSTTVSPTLAITSDKTGLKAEETATISFTFSEATTDFVAADI
ncbi:Ig-like domain-containing protein, partial [Christiangramia aquimixticola]|uniref:Ig-like domain-containing protein n=1 Tax=Christiangramia aquimixticola TaxID=1697558 RepID=UPI003AA96143